MNQQTSILVVDDEQTIREVVSRYLENEGYRVSEAADGYETLDALQDDPPDLIVLDLMLPGIDGLSLTRMIQQESQIPIVMLTAKGETEDRIRGLDLGADDYITKPFSPQEVVSRVRAVLRRVQGSGSPSPEQALIFPRFSIDPASRTVEVEGEPAALTAKEFDLLWHFARHPQRVFTRRQLLAEVWGDELYTDPSTVTVHIRRLREKVEIDPSSPALICTVWGVGYKFVGESR